MQSLRPEVPGKGAASCEWRPCYPMAFSPPRPLKILLQAQLHMVLKAVRASSSYVVPAQVDKGVS